MTSNHRTRFHFKLVAMVLVGAMASPLFAMPGDITRVPAPALGNDAPQARAVDAGDVSVSTQTGNFTYSYPIKVPPGRMGMTPQLALTYSSSAPTYGGVAAGWALDIPEIHLDTSKSLLEQTYWLAPSFGDAWRLERYVSTMAGGRPLIEVNEGTPEADVLATFRAQNDSTYARYERLKAGEPHRWRVLTTDGVVHYFGGQTSARWLPLVKSVDAYGNAIEYIWTGTDISEIRYTSNENANPALPPFATIKFQRTSATCGQAYVGAIEQHGLFIARGRTRLDKIQIYAHTPGTLGVDATIQHTREVTLAYDASAAACSGLHAPLRLLTSIQESAWGDTEPRVNLPAVTFEYNRLARTFDQTFTEPANAFNNEQEPANLGWGQRLEHTTVDAMMLDFDGDGLQDRVAAYPDAGECKLTWQKNMGRQPNGSSFAAPSAPITLPRLPWHSLSLTRNEFESCSLSGQTTTYSTRDPGESNETCPTTKGSSLVYRWIDMTGDGLLDLVTAVHQDTQYLDTNRIEPFGQWPSCGSQPEVGHCPILETTCMDAALTCDPVAETACEYDRDKVLDCFLGAPSLPCGLLMSEKDSTLDLTCYDICMEESPVDSVDSCTARCTTDWDIDPSSPPGSGPVCAVQTPQMRCDGYPWMIYKNLGGGSLATTADIRYQPLPLESDQGDSSFGGRGVTSTRHAVKDIDGDGDLDAIVTGRGNKLFPGFGRPDALWWYVFLGDGNGGFTSFPGNGLPYLWWIPSIAVVNASCTTLPAADCNPLTFSVGPGQVSDFDVRGLTSLADLTGDGLPDYAWKVGASQFTQDPPPFMAAVTETDPVNVFTGTSRGFQWYRDTAGVAHPRLPSLNQSTPALAFLDRSLYVSTASDPTFQRVSFAGTRESKSRLLDFDGDGRLDVVASRYSNLEWYWPALFLNAGEASFQPAPTLSPALRSTLTQRTEAYQTGDVDVPYIWATKEDLADIDGDGLSEAWKFSGSTVTVTRDFDTQPLRLMKSVHNGRGGSTTVTYAPTTNADVVDQHPGLHRALPSPVWVVSSIETTDQWDPDVSTTSYHYTNPVNGPDDEGRWAFRGFEKVTLTAPSGARTVESYDFSVDWSGRLKKTSVYSQEANPTDALTYPASVRDSSWVGYSLFGSIKVFHDVLDRSWTCRNNQTETACQASPGAYLRTARSFYPVVDAGGVSRLFKERFVYSQDSDVLDDGDRYDANFYKINTADGAYRVQLDWHGLLDRFAGAARWQSYETYVYDATLRQAESTTRYMGLTPAGAFDGASAATTSYTYDSTTGARLSETSPNQQPAGLAAVTTYDITQRFPVSRTNEKGQVVRTEYEPGTGALLWEAGPHSISCGPGCTNETSTWTDVDGLGRPVATWVNREAPAVTAWQKTKVASVAYVDAVVSGARPSITSRSLIAYDETRWTEETTQLDSRGRPTVITTRTGASTPSAVTTYDYDARGQMVSATLPDASAAPGVAQYVTYSYTYDSLGRPTSMTRPSIAGQSPGAVTMSYDGVQSQTDEVAGGQGGSVARKVLVLDHLGRLVEVREFSDVAAGSFDSTYYQYDARDAVTRIQNADQVVTVLNHDWAGRRTSIIRADRTWSFTYDKNGNLVSERLPAPSLLSEPNYTNTYVYDELNRVTSRSVGAREFDTAAAALLGIGEVVYSYDSCTGGTGRLCSTHDAAASVIAGVPTPALTLSWTYDAEGNQTSETMAYNVGGLTGTRTSAAAYGPGGKVTVDTFADNSISSPATKTKAKYAYDDRGLPNSLAWVPAPGGADRMVAVQTRNIAGLVTSRDANLSGVAASWRDFSTAFTYDPVGRVLKQEVTDGVSSTPYASQTLTYSGTDDPLTMVHKLGTTTYNFTYGYSARHELTSVGEGAGRYTAAYAYHPGGKLLSATVGGVAQAGGTTVPRDVTYEYGAAVDPEAPSGLKTVGSSNYVRSYAYDSTGNLEALAEGSANVTGQFGYDGDDQLRRAKELSGGTEVGREEYYYDAAGIRRAVVTRNASGTVTAGRLFMGGTEIELTGTGAVGKAFAYLSLGTPVGKVISTGGWIAGQNSTSVGRLELQYHGLADSTLLAIWPNGEVQGGFIYAPYGEVVQSAGLTTSSIASQRRRFNDKFEDDLTGLGYYGVRYYDKVMIGWTQADPMYRFVPDAAWAEPRKAGLYGFVLGNPMRYMDPDGRNPALLPAVVNPVGLAVATATVVGMATGVLPTPRLPEIGWPRFGGGDVRLGPTFESYTAQVAAAMAATQALPALEATKAEPDKGQSAVEAGPAFLASLFASAAASGAAGTAAAAATAPVAYEAHRKNKRRSNKNKHEAAEKRREEGRKKKKGMQWPRKRPPGHKGPWPPPGKVR